MPNYLKLRTIDVSYITYGLIFFISIVIPSLLIMFGANSFASGLSIVSLVYITIMFFICKPRLAYEEFKQAYKIFFYLLFFIFVHGLCNLILHFDFFNLIRFLLSLAFLIYFSFGAFSLFLIVKTLDKKVLRFTVDFVLKLFFCVAFLSFIGYSPFQSAGKPMLFYSEPSHYASDFLPILLSSVIFANKNTKFLYLLIAFEIALISQSVTLLVGILLVSLSSLDKKSFFYLIVFYIALLFFDPYIHRLLQFINPSSLFVTSHQDIISYILNRINFFPENFSIYSNSSNLNTVISSDIKTESISKVMFLSGWERAYYNFCDYFGFGIGFQQLGFIGRPGLYLQSLRLVNLGHLGLLDGASIAPKLFSEFGLFGFFSIIIYLIYFFKIKKTLYLASIYKRSNLDTTLIFYYSVFLIFFINLFIRGAGYFSFNSLLFLSALFFIQFKENSFIKSVKQ